MSYWNVAIKNISTTDLLLNLLIGFVLLSIILGLFNNQEKII